MTHFVSPVNMNPSHRSIVRWILATILIFASLQQCEAIGWKTQPDRRIILVEGMNNSGQSLAWDFFLDGGDVVQNVLFQRNRPGESPITIASRPSNAAFHVFPQFQDEYSAMLPNTLLLINVDNNEEFIYSIVVNYVQHNIVQTPLRDEVQVIVFVPPTITKEPARETGVNTGQTLTLTCNASGDPTPNITWTKEGVPPSQFNVSDFALHLVNVQRQNVGSYRCTAHNGYGEDAIALAIVTVNCPPNQCQDYEVGITITSVAWKQAFANPVAVEYLMLKSNLSTAIASLYTLPQNAAKQLFELSIVEFRSGSTIAVVRLRFQGEVIDPLQPLRDDVADGNLGPYTVARQLDLDPTSPTTSTPTQGEGTGTQEPASSSIEGLTGLEIGGIVGGVIAFVVILIIIGLVCFFCNQKKNAKGRSYSEADGYRMNRRPPPSGLGTASPAYVEARMYAPVNAAKGQDNPKKHPDGGGAGQDGQGGFELWC